MARRRGSALWRTQNFLTSTAVIDPILDRCGIGPGDVVLDVGAGTGTITSALLRRGACVLAVEEDPALCDVLRRRWGGTSAVRVVCRDFLRMPLPPTPYKVFASPPFDVITAVVTKLTEARNPPADTFIAVQREAADRYGGQPSETLYALLLKPWFAPSVVHRFRPQDFRPRPGVDVVMLRLRKRGPPLVPASERTLYRDFVVACFTSWRPTVGAALARALGPRAAGALARRVSVDLAQRPSRLPFSTWLSLFRAFAGSPKEIQRRVSGAERRLQARQAGLRKRHRTRVPRDDLLRGHASQLATRSTVKSR